VARTMVDRDQADELREGCRSMAYRLGGWQKAVR
jgi:hypothetical protein